MIATKRLMLKPPTIDTPAIDTPGVFSLTDPKKFKPPQSHNYNADNYYGSWLTMCSASIQIANFFKSYPERFDRKGF